MRDIHPHLIRYCLIVVALLLVTYSPAQAQTWHAQGPGPNVIRITHPPGQECSVTLYDPEHFFFPDGDFGFLGQGANPNANCAGTGTFLTDSIYTARFDRSTATWTSPDGFGCPTLIGRYMTGGYPHNCGYGTNTPGPLASPDVVEIDGRYFMLFGGGNADAIKGHVFLAVSDDGESWTTFKWNPKPEGYNWRPVIYPYYGGVNDDPCYPFGIGQLALSYDASDTSTGPNGTFYIYLHYVHGTQQRQHETLIFRAPYNPSFPWGVGVGNLEVCQTTSLSSPCTWTPHSGKLVWDYNGKPVANAGDPVLSIRQSGRQLPPGGMDVLWDPQHGNWLRVYKHIGTGVVEWQTTSSQSSGLWSSPVAVDLQPMHDSLASQYPSYIPEELYPGVWYGTAGGRTGMWIRMPVNNEGCPGGVFAGLGVASVGFKFY